MITLLGALLGFLGSVVPDVFSFLKATQDNAQELAILDKQIEVQKLGGIQRLEEINTQADIAESAALNDRVKPMGIKWVDALAGSVRPVITYLFFFAYIVVKFAQYQSLLHVEGLPWLGDVQKGQEWYGLVVTLWGEEDQGLFAAIMCYWFGNRAMDKRRQA
jgi:hypothetical protein